MSFVETMPSTETKCWLFFETLIVVKEEHQENAPTPIIVTLSGMAMEVKEEQPSNALSPIIVTLFGMMIDVKEEHSQNA